MHISKSSNYLSLLPVLAASTLMLAPVSASLAQEKAPPEMATTATGAALTLEMEAPLATKVSLEAKRQPLTEFISALQKQSGVALSVAPEVPSALVTARVQEMPLFEVMSNLSRVYGLEWGRNDGSYRLNARILSPLERRILQTGDPYWYRFNSILQYSHEVQDQADADLASEIYDAVDDAALRSPAGVAFSSLPLELQGRIRQRLEEKSGEVLYHDSLPVWDALNQDLFLQLRPPAPEAAYKLVAEQRFGRLSSDTAGLQVVTSDGHLVTRIFRELAPPPLRIVSPEELMERLRQQKQGNTPQQ